MSRSNSKQAFLRAGVDSLNVAVAAGILLHAALGQHVRPPGGGA